MPNIMGNYIEAGNEREFLMINFSPNSIPLKQRWRNNGLSADFLADYWSTFFPSRKGNTTITHQTELKDAIAYIANELLENAMKFSYIQVQYPVRIALYLHEDEMRFYVTNSLNPTTTGKFKQFIHQLLTEDPDKLYISQLEANANDDLDNDGSNLGFLTMINDYQAELAWKFETIAESEPLVIVTTMVRLNV